MSNGKSACALAAGLLTLIVGSLACEKSPLNPTPATQPRVWSVSPVIGPADGLARIRIVGSGFQSGATVTLGGVAASVDALADTIISATTAAREPGTVDVVVTNPDGRSNTLARGYTFAVISLSASPNAVEPGGQITLAWVGPSSRGCDQGGDWIALFKVGEPDNTGAANGHSDLWFTHVCGATAGTSSLNAPIEPGTYEFRFMIGDDSVARSGPVTVL